jgi:hypothetical protein
MKEPDIDRVNYLLDCINKTENLIEELKEEIKDYMFELKIIFSQKGDIECNAFSYHCY